MRVASYNIRKCLGIDRRRKPDRIIEVLNEIDADIVFLQEVDRRVGKRTSTLSPEMLSANTDYHVADVSVRDHSLGWHGNVILVKRTVQIENAWRIELPTLEPRGAVAADVIFENQKVRCIGVHLALVAKTRHAQIKVLVSTIQKTHESPPTVVAGDFNEWRHTTRNLDQFGDHFQLVTPTPTFHTAVPVAALDRIIISRDIDMLNAGTHKSRQSKVASDHFPIWADLKLPTATT